MSCTLPQKNTTSHVILFSDTYSPASHISLSGMQQARFISSPHSFLLISDYLLSLFRGDKTRALRGDSGTHCRRKQGFTTQVLPHTTKYSFLSVPRIYRFGNRNIALVRTYVSTYVRQHNGRPPPLPERQQRRRQGRRIRAQLRGKDKGEEIKYF